MQKSFIQPDASTCVPTSFAYLLYKKNNVDFQKTLDVLVKECYKRFDVAENGMEFDQMKEVGDDLGFPSQLFSVKPNASAYLTGVTKLSKIDFEYNDFIRAAIKENSLKIDEEFFIYPFGHAIAVFELDNGEATIFDSLFGIERKIKLEEVEKYLEKPLSYLAI